MTATGDPSRSNSWKKQLCKTRVTRATRLLHFKQQRVRIAIHEPAHDLLRVPARLAFQPEFLPRPAPVIHRARRERGLERGFIHPRHHQHAFRFRVLHDRGDEAIGVVFELRIHWVGVAEKGMSGNKKPDDSERESSGEEFGALAATTAQGVHEERRARARLSDATNVGNSRRVD